jgi:predicted DNA-binding transcriptional regulator AlpA
MPDEFLTVEELAGMVRTTPNAVHQWRHRGFGPRGTRIGKRILYRRSDVEQWIAEQTVAELNSRRREAVGQ